MHVDKGQARSGKLLARIGLRVVPELFGRGVAVSGEAPQQRRAVGHRVERRRRRHRGLENIGIDRERLRRVALFERAERLVPIDVAVEDAVAVVAADPLRHQRVGVRHRAVLEHRMQQRMNRIGIVAAQLEGVLGHGAPFRDLAVLGQRPAVIGEEPPILAVRRRVAFAEILPRLVVVGHAGKREQPERAEQ